MKNIAKKINDGFANLLNKLNIKMQTKLILIFLVAKVIPLILVALLACQQIYSLGVTLREIAVSDTSAALNASATENIERMTTDTAKRVADFLYQRDDDIRFLAQNLPSEEFYRSFITSKTGRILKKGEWVLAEDGQSWVPLEPFEYFDSGEDKSSNVENNDEGSFHYRSAEGFEYDNVPLYDEITFVDLSGNEIIKVVSEDSPKINYPVDKEKKDVSKRENTYVKAETYFEQVAEMQPGEIYVSDVIGAYVGANYIGMYTPDIVAAAAETRGYDIEYSPETQAYAGKENPNGQRFEGIVRWATPVKGSDGEVIGYVTFALNHDHIMEFVDHQTPMSERYTELPSAYEGNYAFIWDYQCRSICHPRHNSIVGYDPETGDQQIPWLETSIYEAWQKSGVEKWTDFVKDLPTFDNQSRSKPPAAELTRQGFVGLDGRYLNNAPQCTGWMDLTQEGGSGSFLILWSGLYKLTTAAAIPYYTGQYAPSEANNYSKRGFAFVTIGAGFEDFERPATIMEDRLDLTVDNHMGSSIFQLALTTTILVLLVVLIAIMLASFVTGNINHLIRGISRFRSGERQFRFTSKIRDEFGTLADSFDDMADSIVTSVKNPLTIIDMNRNVIYMNEQGLDFCHMTLEEIVGTSYDSSSVYPVSSEYNPITALENGEEAAIFYVEDKERYIKGTANYFLNKSGKKIGYIIETIDMTDMVLEQMKIEEQRTLLDMIFAASPDLIWYMDTQGTYIAVNPRFSSIAGKTPDEFIGKKAAALLPKEAIETSSMYDKQALAQKEPHYIEEKMTFADGHTENLDAVRTPIFDANGEVVGLLGFARNVSVRVSMENELRKTQLDLEDAVNRANDANQHKGEFLARMSHEIRTPMNAIVGITNIIGKKLDVFDFNPGIEEIKVNMQQIETSSQHLLGLLNDILDISKIEAGKIELSNEPTDIYKMFNAITTMIKPRCDEKSIKFETEIAQLPHSFFLCDSLRLRQVLINLMGNSVKFTPEGGHIKLSMEDLGQEGQKTHFRFSVSDTGIGIASEALPNIFQAFEQASGSVSRQYGGTGLGLAISQRIVELFGGQIEVESTLGEGSKFFFDIWLKQTEDIFPDELAVVDATNIFKGKRLLLVDDVAINRIVVASLLEETGIEIDEADDGKSALEMFEKSAEGCYDVILMDVQMPNMDGYEATEAIRGLQRADAKDVPIIALTANAFKDDIEKALSFGMNAHISKPIETEMLLETIARAVNKKLD